MRAHRELEDVPCSQEYRVTQRTTVTQNQSRGDPAPPKLSH